MVFPIDREQLVLLLLWVKRCKNLLLLKYLTEQNIQMNISLILD